MNSTAKGFITACVCTLLFKFGFAQAPANDDCTSLSSTYNLTSATSCTVPTSGNPAYTLNNATPSTSVPTGCVSGVHYDVWFSFTAASASETVTIGNFGGNIKNPEVEILGSCGATSYLACGTTTATASGLTIGQSYFIRVSNVGTDPSGNGQNPKFDICLTHPIPPPAPPSNDDCANATTLTMGSGSAGTVWLATASSGIVTGCATGDPDDDVWYKFVATSSNTSITLSSVGSDLNISGTMIQLFSGTCGSLASMACAGTSTLYATGLTVGTTYYVRVYSYGTGALASSSGSAFTITATVPATPTSNSGEGSRMNEVFQQTIINPTSTALNDPWEITYGPDGYLWITEAKGYKLYRMDPKTGAKITVLDISQNSTFLPLTDTSFDVQFPSNFSPWPQGGFAGMALHPKFLDPVAPKNFVYVSYVHKWIRGTSSSTDSVVFVNRVVRFTYNTNTGKLESPVSLCDTLPGSSDHNSQRMIIAPVGTNYYLFYAQGDMGAGQFTNLKRTERAQILNSYEGKILRFNLEDDGDAGTLDKWIPNDNPFNGTTQSAVWCSGIRNNQGFAIANINGTDYLYGSSHGPYSDDEVNIIQRGKNYGHPIVIGYAADGNYNNCAAGPSNGSLPLITSESANAAAIGATYQDPITTFYSPPQSTIYNIWTTNPSNSTWPSEAPSGMDIYKNTIIPGWKNSIISSMLKGGKIMRLKLNANGDGIVPTNGADTVSYFWSVNRFRDVALSPDGRSIYAVIDKSSTTSGPTTTNPMVSACGGCVIKYTFLGYNTVNNRSNIPTAIDVATGTANSITTGNTITIDATNNNLWVPITGPDGNVVAEIKANGNNLGTVTTSYYINSGAVRENSSRKLYANRNITITPQVQPSSSVSIRLYMTAAEFNALKSATNSLGNPSGINTISDVSILKNSDPCGAAMVGATTIITPQYAETFGSNYVLQGSISSFSSFYFSNPNMTVLPLQLLSFWGAMQGNAAILQWETINETNSSHFVLERSIDGSNFNSIATITAAGNSTVKLSYSYTDNDASSQPTLILYYRLKMVDLDGRSSYSRIVTLPLNRNGSILVFPNPVKQTLNIKVTESLLNPVIVQITDLNGRVLYSEKRTLPANMNFSIDVRHWKPQMYMLRMINTKNEVLITQKFEKI